MREGHQVKENMQDDPYDIGKYYDWRDGLGPASNTALTVLFSLMCLASIVVIPILLITFFMGGWFILIFWLCWLAHLAPDRVLDWIDRDHQATSGTSQRARNRNDAASG